MIFIIYYCVFCFLQTNRHLPSEEDSLEAEDLFDLEGADSHHNYLSDQDDYDSDREYKIQDFLK